MTQQQVPGFQGCRVPFLPVFELANSALGNLGTWESQFFCGVSYLDPNCAKAPRSILTWHGGLAPQSGLWDPIGTAVTFPETNFHMPFPLPNLGIGLKQWPGISQERDFGSPPSGVNIVTAAPSSS